MTINFDTVFISDLISAYKKVLKKFVLPAFHKN